MCDGSKVPMRRLTPRDYRRMPWRNGGGTTTEIAIAPEGASVSGERFLYRVSIADVATDGPFSRFEGYDRHIMLLAGAGMTLECGEHGRIELRRFEPRAFAGDWAIVGALVAGPVRDFNLMVDRTRATSTLEVEQVDGPRWLACEPGHVCILHVIEGALDGADEGDTLVVEAPIELCPRAAARVAIARVAPLLETATR
jgi:environmental stress-induced protein Ves